MSTANCTSSGSASVVCICAIAQLQTTLALPDDVQMAVDIDPVDLA